MKHAQKQVTYVDAVDFLDHHGQVMPSALIAYTSVHIQEI